MYLCMYFIEKPSDMKTHQYSKCILYSEERKHGAAGRPKRLSRYIKYYPERFGGGTAQGLGTTATLSTALRRAAERLTNSNRPRSD